LPHNNESGTVPKSKNFREHGLNFCLFIIPSLVASHKHTVFVHFALLLHSDAAIYLIYLATFIIFDILCVG